MLFVPDGLADRLRAAPTPTTEFCAAGNDIEMPTPGDHQRRDHLRVGHARVGDQRRSSPGPTACSSGPATRNGRSPKRSTSLPATGATKNSVRGPRQQAQAGAERPVAEARLEELGHEEDRAEQRRRPRRRSPRCRPRTRASGRSRIGSIGARRAQLARRRSATSQRRAAESAPSTSTLPQPAALPRTSPQTTPSTPPLTSAEPRRGRARCPARGSPGSASATSGISASPIGTLSQKIHSHAMPSVIAPPTSGPPATARPLTAK